MTQTVQHQEDSAPGELVRGVKEFDVPCPTIPETPRLLWYRG